MPTDVRHNIQITSQNHVLSCHCSMPSHLQATSTAADHQALAVNNRQSFISQSMHTHTHTPHTSLTALCPGLPRWAGTREVKPIWILLKQETVSGSGIRWAICNSAPRSRQITMPAPHCSVFYRLDALPATQPTASRHWRCKSQCMINKYQIYPRLICFTNKWQRWLAAQYYFQEMIQ